MRIHLGWFLMLESHVQKQLSSQNPRLSLYSVGTGLTKSMTMGAF